MVADLEQHERVAYSSASSTRTIPNEPPAYAIDEESKKVDAEEIEKDIAVEKVEDAPAVDVGDFPDGGLRAWLVVIGVSFSILYAKHETSMLCKNRSVPDSDCKLCCVSAPREHVPHSV